MRILYGVQGTGNGHVSRAKVMAKALKEFNVEVDWVFSGKKREDLYDMEIFGNFQVYRGLTLSLKDGRVDYLKTFFKNNIFIFFREVFSVKFTGYDLILNDYEPILAWAAKIKRIETIGISRQMAFEKDIPIASESFIARQVLKRFAPATTKIGLHWTDFDGSLLPPIVSSELNCVTQLANHILVYFPYVDKNKLIQWFAPFSNYNFHIFHGCDEETIYEHIKLYNFSEENFRNKLLFCGGVISASGFEMSSEAIHMGHKLMVIPLENQMEQQSNAAALELLGRATIVNEFSREILALWLEAPLEKAMPYPDVAMELVKWMMNCRTESIESLSAKLWTDFNSNSNSNS